MNDDFIQTLRMRNVGHWYQRDYRQSKSLFESSCQALTSHAWQAHSWSFSTEPALSTDTIWLGDRDAQYVVVLFSGTHGVEGYCGSAAQSYLLNCLQQGWLSLPESTALLMVHAVNPWGMYWARRCDLDGVDINRNFIDFDQLPEPHPAYAQVLERMAIEDVEARRNALVELAREWGQVQFDRVFSGGQYHCPWAPFYGGRKPSFASRVMDEMIAHWQLESRCLVVIDLHTGLGPWAFGELISDHPEGSQGNHFARQLFGPAVAEAVKGDSFSVVKEGLLDFRWHPLMQERGCYLTLEFGTHSTADLFDVLLSEHLFWRDWQQPDQNDSAYRLHREAMLAHFCPEDSLWQQAVLFKAWQVVDRALRAGGV